jgi:membrane-bound lytic murein transglycosylase B
MSATMPTHRAHTRILIGLTLAVLTCPGALAKTRAADPPPKTTAGAEKALVAKGPAEQATAPDGDKAEEASADRPKTRPIPPAGPRPSRTEIAPLIDRTADQLGVERALVHAVVAAESAYNPNAVSHAGAVGLMQVMPATAGDYGVGSSDALFDPKTNIRTGVRHLKRLLDKYGNDYGRAIMAYNAGEGVVDRTNSNVTYAETLDYTEAVIRHYRGNGGTQPTEEAVRKVGTLRRMSYTGKARRLLKRYLDPALLSLKVRPTLSLESLNPALHRVVPESRPMFELRPLPN